MNLVPFFQGSRRATARHRKEERKATLLEVTRHTVNYCPEHGDQPTRRMVCHCEIADELLRELR